MKCRHISALLLALALLLSGCSPAAGERGPSPDGSEPAVTDAAPAEIALVESEEPAETPEELSPWMEDWNLFWKTLEENYPFEGVLYRTTGSNLKDLELQYHDMAQRVDTAWGLLWVLQKVSTSFGYTGHMVVFDANRYASIYGSVLLGAEGSAVSQYYAELLGSEQSRHVYRWSEEEEETSASGVSGSRSGSAAASDNLTFAYYPEQSAAYVKVRSMLTFGEGFDRDQDLLLDFFQTIEAEGYENCIIDIRHNGGGSDPYSKLLLLAPNLTEALGKTHDALIKGGAETLDFYNVRKLDPMYYVPELYPIEELDLDNLPALEQEDLKGITYYTSMYVGTPVGMDYPDTPAFSGKFWLLISPNVYSASEGFAIVCKDTGFATLVGQTTGGDGIGINPMICVLPNSGIAYQFSTINGLNLDGGSNQEMGTEPDIVVPAGEDALEVCLRAIEEGH